MTEPKEEPVPPGPTPGPGPEPHWSSLHPPGSFTNPPLRYVVQSTAVKTWRTVSKNEWQVETWYNPVAGGTKVYHTPRKLEVTPHSDGGPSSMAVSFRSDTPTGFAGSPGICSGLKICVSTALCQA